MARLGVARHGRSGLGRAWRGWVGRAGLGVAGRGSILSEEPRWKKVQVNRSRKLTHYPVGSKLDPRQPRVRGLLLNYYKGGYVTQQQVWDEILPRLADEFEAGNRHFKTFDPSSAEEYGPLRECLAVLIAEGSLLDFKKTKTYQLTSAGYIKYKPRIDALRVMQHREWLSPRGR